MKLKLLSLIIGSLFFTKTVVAEIITSEEGFVTESTATARFATVRCGKISEIEQYTNEQLNFVLKTNLGNLYSFIPTTEIEANLLLTAYSTSSTLCECRALQSNKKWLGIKKESWTKRTVAMKCYPNL